MCTGRLLGRCCCVLQREFDGVREKEGIRTNALLAVKRNEELSLFFFVVENRCTVLFVRNCCSVEADEGKELKRRTKKKNRGRTGQSREREVCP